jgi:iron complex transport system ATP-binding protein
MPLATQNLSGGYGNQAIIQGVEFALEPGEWLSLVGANGSGKSTLLRLLSRILKPQKGNILLDGKAIHLLPTQEVAQQVALLPQHQRVPSGLTVYQLIALGRSPYQNWWQWDLTSADRHHIQIALAETELEALRDRALTALSGGERQRAFLALALAQSPRVILLDEPTTYLDLHHQLQLLDLLKRLKHKQNLTIVTVLHDLNLAIRYSDRVAILQDGILRAIGPTPQVLTPQNIAQAFGVEVAIITTPIGLQICPLRPHTTVTAVS